MTIEEQIQIAREQINKLPIEIDDSEASEAELDDRTEPIKKIADASNAVNVEPSKRVKILMLQNNVRQIDIVKKYGFDKGDVSKVINFKRKTPPVRAAIAKEVKLPVEELFRD